MSYYFPIVSGTHAHSEIERLISLQSLIRKKLEIKEPLLLGWKILNVRRWLSSHEKREREIEALILDNLPEGIRISRGRKISACSELLPWDRRLLAGDWALMASRTNTLKVQRGGLMGFSMLLAPVFLHSLNAAELPWSLTPARTFPNSGNKYLRSLRSTLKGAFSVALYPCRRSCRFPSRRRCYWVVAFFLFPSEPLSLTR